MNPNRYILEKEFEEMLLNAESIIFKICLAFTDRSPENVEDLYQEIACNLWKGWKKYRNECDVKTWVYRIAYNTAIDDYRSRQHHNNPQFVPLKHDTCSNLATETEDEQMETLYELIDQLSDKDKGIILLYLECYTEKEIAKLTGKSVASVKQTIYRIKNKMRKLYERRTETKR